MANILDQRTVTASMIVLKVEGVAIGRAQGLSPRTSYGTEGIYEIGTIMPQEHVHHRFDGSLSLERFLLIDEDLEKAGYLGLGEDILTKDLIDIEVINKYTNETIRVYRGCTFSDYSLNIRANATIGENATVMYLNEDSGK